MEKLWKKNLKDIEPYVPGEQSKEQNIVKINANENPYPPSPEVINALKNFDAEHLRMYPNSYSLKLKSAIAKHFKLKENYIFLLLFPPICSYQVLSLQTLLCFHLLSNWEHLFHLLLLFCCCLVIKDMLPCSSTFKQLVKVKVYIVREKIHLPGRKAMKPKQHRHKV